MMRWQFVALILAVAWLVGKPGFADSPGVSEATDIFAYCAGVGTADKPVLDTAHPGNYWRCMDGAVYICTVGANIPCDTKADRAKHNVGADSYCRENPDAAIVPAYATGHRTIYEWRCKRGVAAPGRFIARLDRRGFRTDLWRRC